MNTHFRRPLPLTKSVGELTDCVSLAHCGKDFAPFHRTMIDSPFLLRSSYEREQTIGMYAFVTAAASIGVREYVVERGRCPQTLLFLTW